MMVSRWSAKAAFMVTSQRRRNQGTPPLGADVDDGFLGWPNAWGGGTPVFRDLDAYGKETWKMSEN